MVLRAIAILASLGVLGGLSAVERRSGLESPAQFLSESDAGAITGGQYCFNPCVSPGECPGGVDDKCVTHICPQPGRCPDNLIQGEVFVNQGKTWCDGCAVETTGSAGCVAVGGQFRCEFNENCMGNCVLDNGILHCPNGRLLGGDGPHQDWQAQGGVCVNP